MSLTEAVKCRYLGWPIPPTFLSRSYICWSNSRPEYAQYICPLNIKQTAMVGLVGL
jgi:hypothetical protein